MAPIKDGRNALNGEDGGGGSQHNQPGEVVYTGQFTELCKDTTTDHACFAEVKTAAADREANGLATHARRLKELDVRVIYISMVSFQSMRAVLFAFAAAGLNSTGYAIVSSGGGIYNVKGAGTGGSLSLPTEAEGMIALKMEHTPCLGDRCKLSAAEKEVKEDTNSTVQVALTETDCNAAARRQGLSIGGAGWAFSGDFATKGCYTYSAGEFAGHAFYGTGGTEDQLSEKPSCASLDDGIIRTSKLCLKVRVGFTVGTGMKESADSRNAYDAMYALLHGIGKVLTSSDGGMGYKTNQRAARHAAMANIRSTKLPASKMLSGALSFNAESNDRGHSDNEADAAAISFAVIGTHRFKGELTFAPVGRMSDDKRTFDPLYGVDIGWPGQSPVLPTDRDLTGIAPAVVTIAWIETNSSSSHDDPRRATYMRWALARLNADSNLLPTTRLELRHEVLNASTSGTEFTAACERVREKAGAEGKPVVAFISGDSSQTEEVLGMSSPLPTVSYLSSKATLANAMMYPWLVRLGPSDSQRAQAATNLLRSYGWTRPFMMVDEASTWASSLAKEIVSKSADHEIKFESWYAPHLQDITRLNATKADLAAGAKYARAQGFKVIMLAMSVHVELAVRALFDEGVYGKGIVIIGFAEGFFSRTEAAFVGSERIVLDASMGLVERGIDRRSAHAIAMMNEWQVGEGGGSAFLATTHTAYAIDSLQLICSAIAATIKRRVSPLDASELMTSLRTTSVQGLTGTIKIATGSNNIHSQSFTITMFRVLHEDVVVDNAPGVGQWGGYCTCPSGVTYGVGDENNKCGSLACTGGTESECIKSVNSAYSKRRVTCGAAGRDTIEKEEIGVVFANKADMRPCSGASVPPTIGPTCEDKAAPVGAAKAFGRNNASLKVTWSASSSTSTGESLKSGVRVSLSSSNPDDIPVVRKVLPGVTNAVFGLDEVKANVHYMVRVVASYDNFLVDALPTDCRDPSTCGGSLACIPDITAEKTCGCKNKEIHTMNLVKEMPPESWGCRQCLQGLECVGGTAETTVTTKGWFVGSTLGLTANNKMTHDDAEEEGDGGNTTHVPQITLPSLLKCSKAHSCPGGFQVSKLIGAGADVDVLFDQCGEGFTGVECAACLPGYSYTSCIKCMISRDDALMLGVGILLAIFVVAGIVYVLLRRASRPSLVERRFVVAFEKAEAEFGIGGYAFETIFGCAAEGGIGHDEFLHALGPGGKLESVGASGTGSNRRGNITDAAVQALWEKLDEDGDGHIIASEFLDFFYDLKRGSGSTNPIRASLTRLGDWYSSNKTQTIKVVLITYVDEGGERDQRREREKEREKEGERGRENGE